MKPRPQNNVSRFPFESEIGNRSSGFRAILAAALLIACGGFGPVPARAQRATVPPQTPAELDLNALPPAPQPGKVRRRPALSDAMAEQFGNVRDLIDAKQWPAALALIEKAQASARPDSYDLAVILETKARLLLQTKSGELAAIAPWEGALALCLRHNEYFNRDEALEMVQGLAQLHYEAAVATKDKTVQSREFALAARYMEAWMKAGQRPTVEAAQFYSSLLYYKATVDPAHIDMASLKRAGEMAQMGLRLSIAPRAFFYQMLVAIAQAQGDYAQSAQYLEMLVTLPGNGIGESSCYADLVGIYSNLAAQSESKPWLKRSYYARAINAQERAQALGFMNSPRENYNLVDMYYAVGQTGRALELLHAGLRAGTIENAPQNWLALAYFYEEEYRNDEAVAALKEAAALYPDNGEFDLTISQIYEEKDRSAEAFDYAGRAIKKGSLGNHLLEAYRLYAFLGFELGKYSDALNAVEAAEKLPGTRKEKGFSQLKDAINEAMRPASPPGEGD